MKTIRVAQLIDSLDAGGAERMAVNIANLLAPHIAFSGLITTRNQGLLKKSINSSVFYCFLERKNKIDVNAIKKCNNFIKCNNVEVLHAHGSSWFFASIIKLFNPKIKLIWHDHYGNRVKDKQGGLLLKIVSFFFNGIIVVNDELLKWSKKALHCKNIVFINNFYVSENKILQTKLLGREGKRIICVANLRPQKGHLFLVEIAKKVKEKHPDWTFHLVGYIEENGYTQKIKNKIKEYQLEETIFLYGSREDVSAILSASSIGILTSSSEGLPVALLEYGFHQLSVVVTSVGEIPKILPKKYGSYCVPYGNVNIFANKLNTLIASKELRNEFGKDLKITFQLKYSPEQFLKAYFQFLNES